jgi:hypothetical protein
MGQAGSKDRGDGRGQDDHRISGIDWGDPEWFEQVEEMINGVLVPDFGWDKFKPAPSMKGPLGEAREGDFAFCATKPGDKSAAIGASEIDHGVEFFRPQVPQGFESSKALWPGDQSVGAEKFGGRKVGLMVQPDC